MDKKLYLQALEPADLRAGHRVLIHGGSGGVGHIAIQLAKLRGAFVVATCSAKHIDFCKVMMAVYLMSPSLLICGFSDPRSFDGW